MDSCVLTTDTLKSYFVKFGPVSNAYVSMDRLTGKSKGFGFVVFEDEKPVSGVLEQGHELEGRTVRKQEFSLTRTTHSRCIQVSVARAVGRNHTDSATGEHGLF
jgi:RNA recognition motif-containing protein